MTNTDGRQNSFDERATLGELERLREEIERYRAKRKAVSEEFDQFVRSFRTPPDDAIAPPPRPTYPQTEALQIAEPSPASGDAAIAVPVEPVPAPAVAAQVGRPPAPSVAETIARRVSWKTPALVAGAAVLLAGGGLATWIAWNRAPHSPASTAVPETRPPAPSVSRPATEPANQSPASVSELRTTAPVWVRVLADGQRVLERELPANTRVPLTAQKTIVIRAGNAGAVHVTLAGHEHGPLGPEGTVVTRTFPVAQIQR